MKLYFTLHQTPVLLHKPLCVFQWRIWAVNIDSNNHKLLALFSRLYYSFIFMLSASVPSSKSTLTSVVWLIWFDKLESVVWRSLLFYSYMITTLFASSSLISVTIYLFPQPCPWASTVFSNSDLSATNLTVSYNRMSVWPSHICLSVWLITYNYILPLTN
jgi:hypothetical protein